MSIYFTNINIYNTSYSNQILTNFHIKRKSLPRKGGVGWEGGNGLWPTKSSVHKICTASVLYEDRNVGFHIEREREKTMSPHSKSTLKLPLSHTHLRRKLASFSLCHFLPNSRLAEYVKISVLSLVTYEQH